MRPDDAAQAERVRIAAAKEAPRHRRLLRSERDGRVLSALMLPFVMVRPPSGYGVLTTTGRRTGKVRRKCIRVIRRGDRAYIVQLRPPELAMSVRRPCPRGSGTFAPSPGCRCGCAAVRSPAPRASWTTRRSWSRRARRSARRGPERLRRVPLHLRGRPTREKIKELHRYWFDTGIPVVVELEEDKRVR